MTAPTIDEVIAAVRQRMHLPDPGVVEVLLAAWIMSHVPGELLWLLLVGPPSSGKSELVSLLLGLANTHVASDLSLAGLITLGGDRDEHDPSKAGVGLLRDIGDFGIMLALELSTLLVEGQRKDSKVFGALREICTEHRCSRQIRGKRLEWTGTCGFIGAVTEAVDELGMGELGERFVYYRMPEFDENDEIAATLLGLSADRPSTADARELVRRFVKGVKIPDRVPELSDADKGRITMLATFVTRCRSQLHWGSDREITDVPMAERGPRLARVCRQLLQGLRLIGVAEDEAWRVVCQVALGSIRTRRRRILGVLLAADLPMMSATLAVRARLPESSVRHELDELHAFGIVDRIGDRPPTWVVSAKSRDRWLDAVALGGGLDLTTLREVADQPTSPHGDGSDRLARDY